MTKPFFVAFSDLCSFSIFMVNLFLFHRCGKAIFLKKMLCLPSTLQSWKGSPNPNH